MLTALEHRDQTGEGSFVDISQFETTVSCLGPFLLDHELTGTVPQRSGNRLAWLAPQGTYPCVGEDAWVAITVDDDAAWSGLAEVLGGAAGDERFTTLAGRIEHHDEIDELIAAWTATRAADDAAIALQAAGIAACEVYDTAGVLRDPQIRARHWFQVRGSTRFPDGDLFSGHPIHLGVEPGAWWRAGPSMGEDTREVLMSVAGMSSAEVDALIATGGAFEDAEPELKLRRPYLSELADHEIAVTVEEPA